MSLSHTVATAVAVAMIEAGAVLAPATKRGNRTVHTPDGETLVARDASECPVPSVESWRESTRPSGATVEVLAPRGEYQRPDESASQMWSRLHEKLVARQARKDAKRNKMRAEVEARANALITQDLIERETDVRGMDCTAMDLPLSHPDRKAELVARAIGGMRDFAARPRQLTSLNSEVYVNRDGELAVTRLNAVHSHAGQDVLASILGRYTKGFSKPQGKLASGFDDCITVQRLVKDKDTGAYKVESSDKLRLWAMLDRARDFAAMREAGGVSKSDVLRNVVQLRTRELPYSVLRSIHTDSEGHKEVRELTADVGLTTTTASSRFRDDKRKVVLSRVWRKVELETVRDEHDKPLYGGEKILLNTLTGNFYCVESKPQVQQLVKGIGWTLVANVPITDDSAIRHTGTRRKATGKTVIAFPSDAAAIEAGKMQATATAPFTHPAYPGMTFYPIASLEERQEVSKLSRVATRSYNRPVTVKVPLARYGVPCNFHDAGAIKRKPVHTRVAVAPKLAVAPKITDPLYGVTGAVAGAVAYTWRPGIDASEAVPLFIGATRHLDAEARVQYASVAPKQELTEADVQRVSSWYRANVRRIVSDNPFYLEHGHRASVPCGNRCESRS